MFPDSAYAHPQPSFEQPVDLPTVDPNASPTVQVCINADWIKYILGSIQQLLLQSTWNTSDADALNTVQGRANNLIDMFMKAQEGCATLAPNILCISGLMQDLDYGWESSPAAPCSSTWISGTGWQSCHDAGTNKQVLDVTRIFDNPTYIRHAKFCWHAAIGLGFTWSVTFFYLGTSVFTQTFNNFPGGDDCFDADINQSVDAIQVTAEENGTGATTHITLQDWQLCYTGPLPIGSQNSFSHTFDFTLSDGGWEQFPAGSACGFSPQATYVPGVGWEQHLVDCQPDDNQYEFLSIHRPMTLTEITSITVTFTLSVGSFSDTGASSDIIGHNGSTTVFAVSRAYNNPPVSPWVVLPAATIDDLRVELYCSSTHHGGGGGGTATITKIVLTGVGTNPF